MSLLRAQESLSPRRVMCMSIQGDSATTPPARGVQHRQASGGRWLVSFRLRVSFIRGRVSL
eukprot:999991-Pyramimonas_sp.AAC.1